jgi:hypothetical protein
LAALKHKKKPFPGEECESFWYGWNWSAMVLDERGTFDRTLLEGTMKKSVENGR